MLAVRDAVLNAYNQHAELSAVAKSHETLLLALNEADRRWLPSTVSSAEFIRKSIHDGEQAARDLAAARRNPQEASVCSEEAVFNTKEDADCWIAQERRKAGFHVIEAAKATGGFKVVFERRKSSQPEIAPVDHRPLVDALMKIASWSEGDEVSGHFDEPSSATIARKALATVGIVGGVK